MSFLSTSGFPLEEAMQAQTTPSSAASDSNNDDKPFLHKESLRPLSVFQGDKAACGSG